MLTCDLKNKNKKHLVWKKMEYFSIYLSLIENSETSKSQKQKARLRLLNSSAVFECI